MKTNEVIEKWYYIDKNDQIIDVKSGRFANILKEREELIWKGKLGFYQGLLNTQHTL